ncbi:MAG: sigma-54-dependent Fis family transcriptional regulator, partial [Chlorobiaceae bacterium]|nr:sigma-54-dependent Fis family transcriptional regulator [Chlorobiaceae bacterium]
ATQARTAAGTLAHRFLGRHPSVLRLMSSVRKVAASSAPVLILGESGSGKELVADALHELSDRRHRPLVKVNCAALPATLIESELFGHEKGSFTGATERRIGKFELAEGGTIFLDEVGELPLELQAKLLRVLQERELERLGGKGVISVNVRVLAATNRNLEKEVAEGRFREDLFFRLNVFPLFIPPLRERRDDIPLLALYFASKFARLMGKPHREFRESDMLLLKEREWKGYIRELAHLVEQAVIVSDGRWLDFSSMLFPALRAMVPHEQVPLKSMREFEENVAVMERELILQVLRCSNGRVSGEGGAAEKLGMHPKTLYSRIDKLDIRKLYR